MKRKLLLSLLVALFLGAFVGWIAGPRVAFLGDWGFLPIQFIKILVAPLLCLSILESLLKTEIPAKKGAKLILISSANAVVAFFIALLVAKSLPVTSDLLTQLKTNSSVVDTHPLGNQSFHIKDSLNPKNFIPLSIVDPFQKNQVLWIIFLSVLFGIAYRKLKQNKEKQNAIAQVELVLDGLQQALLLVLSWIIKIIPLSVFCVMAKSVGTQGLSVLKTLSHFVGVIALGLFLHAFVYYSVLLKVLTKKSPLRFFSQASDAIFMAFSASSSLAALPVTLKTLEQKLKISHSSARLAACIGTNFNHDGILLYEAAAALFVAQMMGVSLDFTQQLILGFTSVLAAVGIAGVPDAGLITLSLVLSAVGLPLEAVPFLLPVDWILSRLRATTNTISDMVVAQILDRDKMET